ASTRPVTRSGRNSLGKESRSPTSAPIGGGRSNWMRANRVDSSSVCETVVVVPSETSARKSSRCTRPSAVIYPLRPDESANHAGQAQQLARERRALFFLNGRLNAIRVLPADVNNPDDHPP